LSTKRRARSQGRRIGITQRRSARTPSQITIEIEGAKLEVDFLRGHKTGLYLDQKYNYGIVSRSLATGASGLLHKSGCIAVNLWRAQAQRKLTGIEENSEKHFRRETKRCAQ